MEAPPTCYRHPDRETYVRCTRCDRPICPDCMRSASVGFQCPDDVAAGARSGRQARTVFGGRVSGDTSRVSIALIALNVLVFVAGLLLGDRPLQEAYGNLPGPVVLSDGSVGGVATGEHYRLLTAAFLHSGPFHLAMNMLALASLGPVLESALGRSRYLALYLLSALGGSTLSFLLSEPGQLGVGASGAIFGLFGAFYVVVRRLGRDGSQIATLLVLNLVLTVAGPRLGINIDWRAHVGGLVTGTLIAAAMAYVPQGPRRALLQGAACAALLVVLVGAVAARTSVLGG